MARRTKHALLMVVVMLATLAVGWLAWGQNLTVMGTTLSMGPVGIGTTSTVNIGAGVAGVTGGPGAKVSVYAPGNQTFQLYGAGGTSLNMAIAETPGSWANLAGAGDVVLRTTDTAKLILGNGAANTSLVMQNGNVGIGAAPSFPFAISKAGSVYYGKYPSLMVNGADQTGGGIAISNDGGFFDWNDGWITYEKLCCGPGLKVNADFSVTGNVGIGTTTPGAKLSVNGVAVFGDSAAGLGGDPVEVHGATAGVGWQDRWNALYGLAPSATIPRWAEYAYGGVYRLWNSAVGDAVSISGIL